MKQFNPLIPVCRMCGAQHWPGGAHVFENATFTPSAPVVAPVKSRPLVSPDPDQPVKSIDTPPIVDPTPSDSVITVSPPSSFPPARVDTTDESKRTRREQQSAKMRETWAKRRAENAAKKTDVPDWMGNQEPE